MAEVPHRVMSEYVDREEFNRTHGRLRLSDEQSLDLNDALTEVIALYRFELRDAHASGDADKIAAARDNLRRVDSLRDMNYELMKEKGWV